MDRPGPSAPPTHWALLIGIGFYRDKPLSGCVSDVTLIKEFLEKEPGGNPVRIQTLTATVPDSGSLCPPEKEDSWPTYDNITASLEKITKQAKAGNHVYIHYSGHGTRIESQSEYGNPDTGDLALVLFDPVMGERYLPSEEVALLLGQMVKKGVFVTVVLDCCFSGSVVRYDGPQGAANVRTIRYNPAVDAAYPRKPREYRTEAVGSAAMRHASPLAKWLVDPTRSTILSACSPHELAQQMCLGDGTRHGALSFFLVFALHQLRRRGVALTNHSIHRFLCAQFHANWPSQVPVLYGNGDIQFFRTGLTSSPQAAAFMPVFRAPGNPMLQLQAGEAHGICKGDSLAVFPFAMPEDPNDAQNPESRPIQVEVQAVRSLTSDLIAAELGSNLNIVKTGWKARLLTSLSPSRISIRLSKRIADPADWVRAAGRKRFFTLSTDEAETLSCLFSVTVNERNQYEITDKFYAKLVGVPTIAPGPRAVDAVITLLEHLAAFKYFEGVYDRKASIALERAFSLHLRDVDGNDAEQDAAGLITVKDRGELRLTIENHSVDKTLYATVLNMDPDWQITNLQARNGDCVPIPARSDTYTGRRTVRWRMTIPDSAKSQGVKHCEDIVKVILTWRWSSFESVLLPAISSHLSRGGAARDDVDELSSFLEMLTGSSKRGSNNEADKEWVAISYVIRTVSRQEEPTRT